MQKFIIALLVVPLVIITAGCSSLPLQRVIPVEQGNVLEAACIAQLRLGMTKNQINQMLGDPVLNPAFSDNVVDYIYTEKLADGKSQTQKVRLYFAGDRLQKISK